MRKLKLQMQLTIDGFVAGPNGEMDWMTLPWTADINDYVKEFTDHVDTIVLGRKLAEGFIPYWASVATDSNNPEKDAGQFFTNTPKVVFSKTLNESDATIQSWNQTSLAKGDLVNEIQQFKNKKGKDIIAYGGASFISALIQHNLVDEFYLFINPVAIGKGLTIFDNQQSNPKLTLVNSTTFDCGIAAIHYKV